MVLEEIIDKLDREQSPEKKMKKQTSSFSFISNITGTVKPWMGYGISFIVFGLLLIITFKYLLGFSL